MERFLFNLKAQNAHGLHSPFVYELYTQVINPCLQQPGELSTLLKKELTHFKTKTVEKNKFNVQIIDINLGIIDLEAINQEDILVIKHIRKPTNLARWNNLIKNQKIVFSVELFELGLLFFNPIAPKQHFIFKKS